MHGGYYFAGTIHPDKYHLSAEGEITRGVSHQKEQKVKVIIMSSQVILLTPKSQRLNNVLWSTNIGHEGKRNKERDSYREEKRHVDRQELSRRKKMEIITYYNNILFCL